MNLDICRPGQEEGGERVELSVSIHTETDIDMNLDIYGHIDIGIYGRLPP